MKNPIGFESRGLGNLGDAMKMLRPIISSPMQVFVDSWFRYSQVGVRRSSRAIGTKLQPDLESREQVLRNLFRNEAVRLKTSAADAYSPANDQHDVLLAYNLKMGLECTFPG